MGYLELGVLILTGVAIVLGTLFGLCRGRNRSILRLILIIGCIVGAYFLREIVADFLMDINLGQGRLVEVIVSIFGGEQPLPTEVKAFIVSYVEVLIGVVAYFLVFFALRFVSWIIIYPICKAFVKKDLFKKRGRGALIGFIQGIIIAFAVLAPASGLINITKMLTKIEIDGQPMLIVNEELGLEEYEDTFIGKTYLTIGGWYYDLVAPSLDDSTTVIVSTMRVVQSIQDFSASKDIINNTEKTSVEKADELKRLGNSLQKTGAQLEELSDNAEQTFDKIISSISETMGEEIPTEVKEFFEDLKVSDLNMTALGNAIYSIGEYFEKTDVEHIGEKFSQEDANKIVNGFVQNEAVLELLEEAGSIAQLIDIDSEYESLFSTAIDNAPEGTDKGALKTLLGIA